MLVVAAAGCSEVVTVVAPEPTAWPVTGHSANSDPWLVDHNQVITSMSPAVLVLNFDPAKSSGDTLQYANDVAQALAVGSMYHGYSEPTAVPFLNYQVKSVIDLTMVQPPVIATPPPTIDLTALFNDASFPPLFGYSDGAGGFLSLCQLFEQGVINEVWIQDGGDAQTTPRAPLYAERKQVYDANWQAIPGDFLSNLGLNTSNLAVSCGVTVRVAHLDPSSTGGVGCDVEVRGWGIDSMWSALPGAATDANAFLNLDFNTRFPGVMFAGWPFICTEGTPCVSYPSPTIAANAPGLSMTFTIDPFLQGCGSSLFPSNATTSRDFEDTVAVDARCEGFGLRGGPGGQDLYQPYSNAVVASYDSTGGASACPAGWQIYWRQSMPGYANKATASDGTPMKNWWPMLFY